MKNRERILVAVLGAVAACAHADLKPMSDHQMGKVTGQAMIAVDSRETADADFTRITLGMDAEVQTNIETVALAEQANAAEPTDADLLIDRFSLGHISPQNDIVPFVGKDPYFELAENGGEIIGFRMGFGEAEGTLSGNISSFSGNIGLMMESVSQTEETTTTTTTDPDTGETIETTETTTVETTSVEQAQLMNADGTVDSYRATHLGVPGEMTDCAANVNCISLNDIKTWDVGVDNGDGTTSPTKAFFLAFQKDAVNWQTDAGTGETITGNPGAFLNLPTSMTLDAAQLQTGVPRARTEFIDRGLGLF